MSEDAVSDPANARPDERVPMKIKVFNLLAVITPLVGLVTACILLWGVAFDWVHLIILAVMYLLTGYGVTVGYHRLFTHRSFKPRVPSRRCSACSGPWPSRAR